MVYSRGLCRSCYEKRLRDQDPDFAERQRENRRQRGTRRADRVRELAEHRKTDPRCRKRDRETRRRARLRKQYGLEVSEIDDISALQNHRCAICERNLDEVARVHVDHCHDGGHVRGLLCSRCNNGLGMFEDNARLLKKAASYVEDSDVSAFLGSVR
ncbi:endonuclease VII domain-containing protein [Aurantimonas sp. A2-1-M11]|uniref:endonuclease VII domain-containing protein n=1 Tax=Aurantimonas sp. A2-1-M11 TaxID=3113712 RepID=UPI003FA60761